MIADGRAELVRSKETFKDLVSRDVGGDEAPEAGGLDGHE
jgi:hypothetical protein